MVGGIEVRTTISSREKTEWSAEVELESSKKQRFYPETREAKFGSNVTLEKSLDRIDLLQIKSKKTDKDIKKGYFVGWGTTKDALYRNQGLIWRLNTKTIAWI